MEGCKTTSRRMHGGEAMEVGDAKQRDAHFANSIQIAANMKFHLFILPSMDASCLKWPMETTILIDNIVEQNGERVKCLFFHI